MDAPALDLTVIVPCYNEGPTLAASLVAVAAELDRLGRSWEMILIDDGSRDESAATADAFARLRPERVRTAHHARNQGRGAAVRHGLLAARGRYAGFMDIDREVSESFIGPCLQALDQGADVACGCRSYELALRSLLRHVLSKGYVALMRWALHTRLTDTESGFKWFRRAAILPVLETVKDDGWFFDTEIMVRAERAGLAIAEVPVVFVRRPEKVSTVRPLRDSLVYLGRLRQMRAALRRE